jgi:hypothetical protein
MRAHFGDVKRILFVPYALADHDGYVASLHDRGLDFGYEIDGIHRHADPVQAVQEAEAIYIGGGNSFRLISRTAPARSARRDPGSCPGRHALSRDLGWDERGLSHDSHDQ